jgi:alkanesulfonate monooxygenase SsuD/methylene tetrahydromethanopterin reductase-like flavin-dependent oxidoreductase (luciferase family)
MGLAGLLEHPQEGPSLEGAARSAPVASSWASAVARINLQYAASGFLDDYHVSRIDEAVQINKALLGMGNVDFQGICWTARDCDMRPRGLRSERPLILVVC